MLFMQPPQNQFSQFGSLGINDLFLIVLKMLSYSNYFLATLYFMCSLKSQYIVATFMTFFK